jgi:hypothetical protein
LATEPPRAAGLLLNVVAAVGGFVVGPGSNVVLDHRTPFNRFLDSMCQPLEHAPNLDRATPDLRRSAQTSGVRRARTDLDE